MSESVDADDFTNRLSDEQRWTSLRDQLDIVDVAQEAANDDAFRNTLRVMFEQNRDEFNSLISHQVRDNKKTTMDLRPLFDSIWGDNDLARSFWGDSVMPLETTIMDNIESRLANRGYDGDEQLWSAIEDMDLLSPERTRTYLKQLAFPPQGGADYQDFVSLADNMLTRRDDFFAPISDTEYTQLIADETNLQGTILEAWRVGKLIIQGE
jgi:hypothetical protein